MKVPLLSTFSFTLPRPRIAMGAALLQVISEVQVKTLVNSPTTLIIIINNNIIKEFYLIMFWVKKTNQNKTAQSLFATPIP